LSKPMMLAEMAWVDVHDYLQSQQTLLIPVGTCEQHGPHLPLGTDLIVADELAKALSTQVHIPVAPPLSYGVNLESDYLVPGTAGVNLDCLRSTLRQVVAGWAAQGFNTFFVVTAHACSLGGSSCSHETAIREALTTCMLETACSAYLLFPYWISCADLLTHQSNVEHACEMETALMLHLRPDLVHLERIHESSAGSEIEDSEEAASSYAVMHHLPLREVPTPLSFQGFEGVPTVGTAEKGRLIFERWVRNLSAVVHEILSKKC